MEATPTPEVPPIKPELPVSNPLTPLIGPGNRRKGKVARKTKEVRNRINHMLLDGSPYLDIIAKLGDDGKDLNEDNLTNWRSGGYQEWLREEDRREMQNAKKERTEDLASDRGSKIHQATLQIAAANMCDLLTELEPCELREILEKDPDKYTRLLNALVRLSDGQLRCEEHQAKQAAQAKTVPTANQGGISETNLAQAKEALNLM
jgi:hypothetical protein